MKQVKHRWFFPHLLLSPRALRNSMGRRPRLIIPNRAHNSRQINWRFLKPFFSRSGFLCTYCQPEAFEFHHVSKVKVGSKWYWDASSVGHGYFWSTHWTSTISRSSKPLEDGDAFEQAPHECQLFHEGLFICLSYRRRRRHGIYLRLLQLTCKMQTLLESALFI